MRKPPPAPSEAARGVAPWSTRDVAALLVEDNPGDAMLTTWALQSVEGLRCKVVVVETLALAAAFLRAAQPDVILLDLHLPDGQGLDALAALRAAAPDVPVVVLSGTDALATVQVMLEHGADDYLVKGEVEPADMARSIRYAVSRRSALRDLFVSEGRFRALFADNAMAMQCLSPDGAVLDANAALAELAGLPVEELVRRHVSELTHPGDRAAEAVALRRLADDGTGSVSYAKRVVRPDGVSTAVHVRATAVRDATGAVVYTTGVLEDLTEAQRQQADAAFRAHVLACITQAVVVTDADGVVLYGNAAAGRLLGLRPDAVGTAVAAAVQRPLPHGACAVVAAQEGTWSGELFATADSPPVLLTVSPVSDDSAAFTGWVFVGSDITDRKKAAIAFTESEARLDALVNGIHDVISVHKPDGALVWMSQSGARVLGGGEQPAPGDLISDRLEPSDREALSAAFAAWLAGSPQPVTFRVAHAERGWVWCESVGTNLLDDPTVNGVVVITRDVTERRRAEEALAYQAVHDPMTELPNRVLFMDRLEQAVERARRSGEGVAVICLDLDNFQLLNDSVGPAAGDDVIRSAAALFSAAVRPGDTIARLDGDEFGVVCEGVGTAEEAVALAERLRAAVAAPFGLRERKIRLTASAGVAASVSPAVTAEALLQDADVALNGAKRSGRDRTVTASGERRAEMARRVALKEALQDAAANGEFELHYQPIVNVDDGRVNSFEALLRWASPTLGTVMPSEFIPILEETDSIVSVGRWVIQQATSDLAAWRALYPRLDLGVSVNVSSRQLPDEHLVSAVEAAIAAAGIPPGRLCLEITESVMIEDPETAATLLRRLKSVGVKLAVDDFGTGYSALAYLKRFPIDHVKIDRAFVRGLGTDPDDTVIVASVVELGRRLGLDVVAEGVEDEHQLRGLRELGCRWGQGFLWSRPKPAADVAGLLDGEALRPTADPDLHAAATPSSSRRDDDGAMSVLAQELRAPLAVIRGFAETISTIVEADDNADGNRTLRAAADAIVRQATGLTVLADAMADVRSLEAGTLSLDMQREDVGEAVAAAVADLQPAATGCRLALDVRSSGPAMLDGVRFRQLVRSLLDNAVRHSPTGATVDVVVEAAGAEIFVRVVDRGPGVPADRIGELFKKFSRVDGATKGAGLGLYVARGVARAHGGEIAYRRAHTGGAEFVVTVPAADQARRPQRQEGGGTPVEVFVRSTPARLTPVFESPVVRRDAEVLALSHAATRALFDAECPEQVVGVGIDLVLDVGGHMAPTTGGPHVLGVDMSFGDESLFAAADPMSVARRRLEAVLPTFARDAQRRIAALRQQSAAMQPLVDVDTGLVSRRGLEALSAADATTGAVGVVMIVEPQPLARSGRRRVLQRASRLLRAHAAAGDTLVRWAPGEILLIAEKRDEADVRQTLAEAAAAWGEWRPAAAGLVTAVADLAGGVRAGRAAARRAADHERASRRLASVEDPYGR